MLEQRIYYCQNQHADVVSLITSAGGMREMDRYSAYGVPFGLPVGDANSDGKSNSADRTQIQNWIDAPDYDVRGDLDLDGDVDPDDKDLLLYTYGVVNLGRGILSASAVGNRRGVAGYEIDPKLAAREYCVRNRVLASEVGIWMSRDPAGYVDTVNLFECVRTLPHVLVDPSGLGEGWELDADPKKPAKFKQIGPKRILEIAGQARKASEMVGNNPQDAGVNFVRHCVASCQLCRETDFANVILAANELIENLQGAGQAAKGVPNGKREGEDDKRDQYANAMGRTCCKTTVSCEECCWFWWYSNGMGTGLPDFVTTTAWGASDGL